jgi:hypothetical protein
MSFYEDHTERCRAGDVGYLVSRLHHGGAPMSGGGSMTDRKTNAPELECGKCAEGLICEQHPELPWPHDDCAGPRMPCEKPACPCRIDMRPVKTSGGLVCPQCRQA